MNYEVHSHYESWIISKHGVLEEDTHSYYSINVIIIGENVDVLFSKTNKSNFDDLNLKKSISVTLEAIHVFF